MKLALMSAVAALALVLGPAAEAKPKHCPPGHAKKGWCSPGAQQPGEHVFRDERGNDYVLVPVRRGERLSNYRYDRLDDYDRYSLPPLRPGERYYVIDGQVVRVDEATSTVLGLMGLAQSLLN